MKMMVGFIHIPCTTAEAWAGAQRMDHYCMYYAHHYRYGHANVPGWKMYAAAEGLIIQLNVPESGEPALEDMAEEISRALAHSRITAKAYTEQGISYEDIIWSKHADV